MQGNLCWSQGPVRAAKDQGGGFLSLDSRLLAAGLSGGVGRGGQWTSRVPSPWRATGRQLEICGRWEEDGRQLMGTNARKVKGYTAGCARARSVGQRGKKQKKVENGSSKLPAEMLREQQIRGIRRMGVEGGMGGREGEEGSRWKEALCWLGRRSGLRVVVVVLLTRRNPKVR